MSTPPLRIYKNVNIDKLLKFKGNSRVHSENQINQIVKSIKEFGFTNPCLIDENNNVIAGHGRLEAAKKLKLSEIPCIVIEKLTEVQRRALVIADNKLALNAGWDFNLLKTEFEYFTQNEFDFELTGFDIDEIDDVFQKESNIESDIFGEASPASYQVIAECLDAKEQERLCERLKKDGYKCKMKS